MSTPLCRAALLATGVSLIALVSAVAPAKAQTLTDIVLFRADANGNSVQEGWNTRGADSISNLYLKSGPTFVNSGNAAAANIAIDLSAPGTYTFDFVGDNVNSNTGTALGINFFFNSNATTPSLSARGPQGGGFFANGGQTNTPTFASVTGANALTFTNNGRQITLTNFSFQTTGGPDQVSSFNNAANGVSDTNGSFTLTVGATAPEPATLGLFCMSALLVGIAALRRQHN